MDHPLLNLVLRCQRGFVVSRGHHIVAPLLMIALVLLSCTAALAADQSLTAGAYLGCNTERISSNDTILSGNLNAVVQSLSQNSSKTWYSAATSLSGSDNSSYVYGIYQCRGDVSLPDCSSCVSTALSRVTTSNGSCGYQAIGARAQYTGCYIRYETYPFASALEGSPPFVESCSASKDSDPVYQHNVGTALNSTAIAAPKHSLFGYNASSVGTGSSRAYALSQCLGYLSPSQCAACLSAVSNYSAECSNAVSGGVYYVDCYYLYDNTSFLFTNNSTPSTNPPAASPPSSSPQEKSKKHVINIIVGIVVGTISLAIIIALATLALCYLKRRRKKATNLYQARGRLRAASDELPSLMHELPQLAGGATRFSLKELQDATDNFNPRNKLGEGGFGPVYQGVLKSGREVAIKMLSAESRQGKTQFINEVNLITTVQHRNLVQLIGYCVEDCKPMLVYEYLPNRSLDLHLFGVGEKDSLNWSTRFEIIVGIARGLTYLHQDSHLRIVHRDIKASNILLDNNLNPKIADFGLARLFGEDMSHLTTKVVGTLGYLSPEYAMGGQLSEKADVYSFGLVALEIVSGRRVIDNKLDAEQQNLLEWTWALYEKQQQVEIVDKRLQEGIGMYVNVGEVVRVVHVALLCTQSQPHLRPRMPEVYNMLNSNSSILDLPTKPITIGILNAAHALDSLSSIMPSSTSHSSQLVFSSYNEEPISEVQPR